MSKYCKSCGAANANAANVCTRCGKLLEGGGIPGGGWPPPSTPPQDGISSYHRMIPLKYQIGSIVMFVMAGLCVLLMLASLANPREVIGRMFMQSRDIWSFSSLEEIQAMYIGISLVVGLIGGGIYLHCGFLLRRTQLHSKGTLILYSILFGLSALSILLGFGNANYIEGANVLSLILAVGTCVLLIMKAYDVEMAKKTT